MCGDIPIKSAHSKYVKPRASRCKVSRSRSDKCRSALSTGTGSGWQPKPLILRDQGRIRGAVPIYVKSHSQGEYIFDHGWADALNRAGGQYYPKLQVAVPFTPATGRRFLGDEAARDTMVQAAIIN